MKITTLLEAWAQSNRPIKTAREYAVRLPIDDAARLHALAELFPARTEEDILTDLLGAALVDLEASMPYQPGTKVIARDEQNDPIYEDIGLTPRFEQLVRKHRDRIASQPR